MHPGPCYPAVQTCLPFAFTAECGGGQTATHASLMMGVENGRIVLALVGLGRWMSEQRYPLVGVSVSDWLMIAAVLGLLVLARSWNLFQYTKHISFGVPGVDCSPKNGMARASANSRRSKQPMQALTLIGDACWRLVFENGASIKSRRLAMTGELLEAMAQRYPLALGRFNLVEVGAGRYHVEVGNDLTAAEVISRLARTDVLGARGSRGSQTGSDVLNSAARWTAEADDDFIQGAWVPYVSAYGPRSVEEASKVARASNRYCYAAALFVDTQTHLDDMRLYGTRLDGKELYDLAKSRGLLSRRVTVTFGAQFCHIEADASGLTIDEVFGGAAANVEDMDIGYGVSDAAQDFFMFTIVYMWLTWAMSKMAAWGFGQFMALSNSVEAAMKGAYKVNWTNESSDARFTSPGYCYLVLFRPDRRRAVARVLGAFPRALAVVRAKPDFEPLAVTGNWWLAHVDGSSLERYKGGLEELARRGTRLGLDIVKCSGCARQTIAAQDKAVRMRQMMSRCVSCNSYGVRLEKATPGVFSCAHCQESLYTFTLPPNETTSCGSCGRPVTDASGNILPNVASRAGSHWGCELFDAPLAPTHEVVCTGCSARALVHSSAGLLALEKSACAYCRNPRVVYEISTGLRAFPPLSGDVAFELRCTSCPARYEKQGLEEIVEIASNGSCECCGAHLCATMEGHTGRVECTSCSSAPVVVSWPDLPGAFVKANLCPCGAPYTIIGDGCPKATATIAHEEAERDAARHTAAAPAHPWAVGCTKCGELYPKPYADEPAEIVNSGGSCVKCEGGLTTVYKNVSIAEVCAPCGTFQLHSWPACESNTQLNICGCCSADHSWASWKLRDELVDTGRWPQPPQEQAGGDLPLPARTQGSALGCYSCYAVYPKPDVAHAMDIARNGKCERCAGSLIVMTDEIVGMVVCDTCSTQAEVAWPERLYTTDARVCDRCHGSMCVPTIETLRAMAADATRYSPGSYSRASSESALSATPVSELVVDVECRLCDHLNRGIPQSTVAEARCNQCEGPFGNWAGVNPDLRYACQGVSGFLQKSFFNQVTGRVGDEFPFHQPNVVEMPCRDEQGREHWGDSMYRADLAVEGLREPQFKTLHHLAPEVIYSSLSNTSHPRNRRRVLWDLGYRYTKKAFAAFDIGQLVVVTAQSRVPLMCTVAPSQTVPNAHKGIVYVASLGAHIPHPDWSVVVMPLHASEGRLLAGFRNLPLVIGRTDVELAFVNAARLARFEDRAMIPRLLEAGLGCFSVTHAMVPTNLGCAGAAGCCFRPDRAEIADSFSRFGHVYGWDESVWYVRSPTVYVNANVPTWGYASLVAGVVYKDVTLVTERDGGYYGTVVENFGLNQAEALARGDELESTTRSPHWLVNSGWSSIDWAHGEMLRTCARLSIPTIAGQFGKRLPRWGKRCSNYARALPDSESGWVDAGGATWRRADRAFGLRDRFSVSTTQNLAPELWAACRDPVLTRPEEHFMFEALDTGAARVASWVHAHCGPQDIIAIMSVKDHEQAEQYMAAHSNLFTKYVVLSEAVGADTVKACWITLPVLYGNGNYFQLARLIPGIYTPAWATFTVINDLETDWLPRGTRLEVGLAALEMEDVVFPAMEINSPTPFQDVVFRGGAFEKKRVNLLKSICAFGWIYGFDEVWCNVQDYPTVAVQDMIGRAATAVRANPKPSRLWRLSKSKSAWREYVCAGGNFRATGTPWLADKILDTRALKPSWWKRFKRAVLPARVEPARYYEFEPHQWSSGGDKMWEAASAHGKSVLFVTWGTWGDRVPILAAAKAVHRLTGITVFVRHCVTLEEGKAMLALCEADSALSFVADLVGQSYELSCVPGNKIMPDYLTWGTSNAIAYSLRPGEADAMTPGGGLPPPFEQIVQFIYWKDRARIRVGLYKGLTWFPRSADGEKFLAMAPLRPVGSGKQGLCIGSSTLPVPDEYKDWERVPNGNHYTLGFDYSEIVCDGGAGKVQTFRAAGVPIIRSTNNKIDRKYVDPNNCGKGCTGNERASKWVWAAAAFYPSLLVKDAGVNPVRWLEFCVWLVNPPALFNRLWFLLFFAYSLRYKGIMPTIEQTLLVGAGFAGGPGWWNVIKLTLATRGLALYATYSGKSYFRLAWAVGRATVQGIFSPVTSVLIGLGVNTTRAALIGAAASNLTLPPLGRVKVCAQLHPNAAGVWLIFTPVYVWGMPIGVHAGYYHPASSTVWEGIHVERRGGLGGAFKLRKRQLCQPRPLVSIRSSLTVEDLPSEDSASRPYSALWNCQAALLGLFLHRSNLVWGLEAFMLIFFSGYAALFLGAAAVAGFLAASTTATVMLAMTPFARAFPEWELDRKAQAAWDFFTPTFALFAGEPSEVEDPSSAQSEVTEEEIRDTAAAVAAEAILAGFDEDVVFHTIADAVLGAAYAIEEDKTPSLQISEALFEVRRGPSELGRSPWPTWINNVVHAVSRASWLPPRAVEGFAAFMGALLAFGESLTEEILAAVAGALDWLHAHGVNVFVEELTAQLNSRIANLHDSAARRKNVWAILSKKRLEALRRADWLALSIKPCELVSDDGDTANWLVRLLNRHHPAGETLEEDWVYKVPSWLPKRPRVSSQEFKFHSLFEEAEAIIDPELTERVEKYLRLGGSVGLDGMWVATDEMREKVTSRYFSEPNAMTPEQYELAADIANMLFEAHPEAFDAPALVRPETVRQRLNMKGRAGIPFMQKVRSRRELEKSGWMQAIISATYECIESGIMPPDAYSEFAKMMVLDAETISRKGPRTIMATSLVTNFVNGVYELERRTRKTWPTTNTGAGAPLTAGYLGKMFEQVASRATVFTADATAFDANIPPVLFEVLSLLSELGAKASIPLIGSALRAKYVRLQNAVIYDLPSGKVWPKRRGGATGQSATSWDNTWAMRALMVATWAEASGLPATDFYKYNTVHNTGDDNIWGTDSAVTAEELSAAAKRLFGVDIRIEGKGLEELSYLSKVAVPGELVADEILRVLDYVPRYTAVHDTSRLLTRRGAVVSRFAGAPYSQYKLHLTERTIGHALLTAHNRPIYDMLAHEYMEDLRKYIAARPYAVVYDITRDESGQLESVLPRFVKGYVPTESQKGRLGRARTGNLQFPTYQRVLEAAYASKEVPPVSQYAQVKATPSLERVLREYIVKCRFAIHEIIPDALVKLAPSPTAAPYSPIFFTWGFPCEKFVWRTLPATADFAEFAGELRQAPWSITTDPTGFWWYLQVAGNQRRVQEESIFIVRGRMVAATVAYAFLTEAVHLLRSSRVGLLVEAFQVYTQDAPRVFALLDSLHWLETSRSSPVISSLTPRDPYGSQKMLAMWIAAVTPDWLCALLGGIPSTGIMAQVATLIARFRLIRAAKSADLALKTPHQNRWEEFADNLLDTARQNVGRGVLISAPTSTGKSTEFPAALLSRVQGRVWVVAHTRYLRTTYANPWVHAQNTIKLSVGVVDQGQRLVVTTYGHLCARVASGAGPTEEDVIIFDEFHERQPIQGIAAWTLAKTCPIFYASATPDRLYVPADAPYISIPIEREFGVTVPVRLDLPPMALWGEAKNAGVDVSRCVFIVPSVAEVYAIVMALQTANEPATAVTANKRVMPATGHLVGTSVLEAGVNITPPATCLIDSGRMVVSDKGRVVTTPTDPTRATQRLGRVGRRGDGAAYVHSQSGTGQPPLPYPTYLDVIAAHKAREWLLSRLGIVDPVSLPPVHDTDPHMWIERLPPDVFDIINSLRAWWLMSMAKGSVAEANRLYDMTELSGWPEEMDSVSNLLGKHKWLLPRRVIQERLDSRPYRVIWDGEVVKPLTIILRDGRMHWL